MVYVLYHFEIPNQVVGSNLCAELFLSKQEQNLHKKV